MSLINQMLRDLESRRAAERRQQGGGIFSGLTSDTTTTAHTRWLILLAAGVIGLLLILVAYLAWQRFMAPATSAPATRTATNAQPAAPSTPAAPAPTAAPVIAAPTPGPARPSAAVAQATETPPAPAAAAASPAPATEKMTTDIAPMPARKPEPLAESTLIEKTPRPLSLTQQADRAYQQAVTRLRDGNNAAAESSLREALRLDHEHLQARETLGAMLLGAGRVVEATQVLEAGRRFFSRNPTLALLMARVLVEQADHGGAIITLEQNLAAGSARGDYLAFLAALYQRTLRYNDSINAYQQALTLEPAQGSSWAGLAISLENAGRGAEAVEAYKRAAHTALPPQLARYVQERLQALAHD